STIIRRPSSTHFPYTTLFRSYHDNKNTAITRKGNTLYFLFSIFYFFRFILSATVFSFVSFSTICRKSASFFFKRGIKRRAIFPLDRKSTRLNSSHVSISYAVF